MAKAAKTLPPQDPLTAGRRALHKRRNAAQDRRCLLYTLRAHETKANLVCRLLLEKKKKENNKHKHFYRTLIVPHILKKNHHI